MFYCTAVSHPLQSREHNAGKGKGYVGAGQRVVFIQGLPSQSGIVKALSVAVNTFSGDVNPHVIGQSLLTDPERVVDAAVYAG